VASDLISIYTAAVVHDKWLCTSVLTQAHVSATRQPRPDRGGHLDNSSDFRLPLDPRSRGRILAAYSGSELCNCVDKPSYSRTRYFPGGPERTSRSNEI